MKSKVLIIACFCMMILNSISFAEVHTHNWEIYVYQGYNEKVHKVVERCSTCKEKRESKEEHKYRNRQRECYRCGYSKDYGYNKPKTTATPTTIPTTKPTVTPTIKPTTTPTLMPTQEGSTIIPVSSIILSINRVTLSKIGTTRQLSARVLPENATNKKVTWSSSNNAVARVNSYGMVTAIGKGVCIITCKDSTGKVTTTCEINVGNVSVTPTLKPTTVATQKPTPTATPIPECKHKTKDWVVTKEATCNENGEKSQICSTCGKVLSTKAISKLSHKYKYAVTKEASCIEDGQKEYTCSLCGNVNKTAKINKLGHKYDSKGICTRCGECKHKTKKWIVTKESTCLEEGVETNICQVCNKEIETRSIAKAHHKFQNGVCTVCGKEQDTTSQYINVERLIQVDKPLIKQGTYTEAQWNKMEKELKLAIEEGGGKGTRGGLVAAAEYLASMEYRVPYSRHSDSKNPSNARRHWNKVGLNHKWGTNSWGLDCTGFVSWAYKQAGLKMPGIKVSINNWVGRYYDKVKPGDIFYVVGPRRNRNTGETSYTQTHVALIIEVNDEGFWIAESDTKRDGGVMTTFYSYDYIKKLKAPTLYKDKAIFISPLSSKTPEGNIRNLITNY